MRETIQEKAVRYLAEGRVRVRAVNHAGVEADVQGSGKAVYRTRREGLRWSVTAPPGNASVATFEPCGW
jgi:molybdopterin-guanine dinucleotide biosynthesis protein